LQSPKGNIRFAEPERFCHLDGKAGFIAIRIDASDVVFAGFGVVAPEYNWNDYAGLDVKGKIVLVMVNDPGFYDSTLFKGHTMTYYGRWTYKYEEAARQGAKACLIIHNTAAASYPFTVVQSSMAGSSCTWIRAALLPINWPCRAGSRSETAKKFLHGRRQGQQSAYSSPAPGFKAVPLNVKVIGSLSR
jgi:hypothetical protein